MDKYYVQGKEIVINTDKKPFASGSEGRLFLINDKLYKIYYPNALNEGFGNKFNYHQSLLGLSNEFKHFVLPEDLIFDQDGNYVGYVTELKDKIKQKEGVTGLNWDQFLSNIRSIEIEVDKLSEYRFLVVDVGFHNTIFNKEDKKLYMIDPGRYQHQAYFTIHDYKRRNNLMISDCFRHILERDVYYFKLARRNKVVLLFDRIKQETINRQYSEYFENISKEYESVHDYLVKKLRYLK